MRVSAITPPTVPERNIYSTIWDRLRNIHKVERRVTEADISWCEGAYIHR